MVHLIPFNPGSTSPFSQLATPMMNEKTSSYMVAMAQKVPFFFGFKHSTTIPQLEMKYPSNWMVHQNWPSKNMYPGAFMASHDCDLKTSLKYVAVLALHRRGWLDRYNGVPRKVIAGAQAWQKSIGAAEEFECSLDFGVGKSFWEWKLRDFDDVWEVRHHWKLFLFWMDSFFLVNPNYPFVLILSQTKHWFSTGTV